jgi:hypothetical protein
MAVATVVSAMASSVWPPPCRFARGVTCQQLLLNTTVAQDFVEAVMYWEGSGFAVPGVGYEPVTGHTYDGHPLNYSDGTLASTPHGFSAPSKESVHVSLLAQAVAGNAEALLFAGGSVDAVVALLARKMDAYEAFNASYPGYGCFLPWVNVSSAGLAPLSDWSDPYRVPGLDNGEWVWAIFAAAVALNGTAGQAALAARYQAWFSCMAGNAKTIFYQGGGMVASVVIIANATGAVVAANYQPDGSGVLNDPYEGETLTVLLDLFAPWNNATERDQLWVVKRPLLLPVNYTLASSGNNITVQRGWWFSSHEQWKTLLLPYFDVPIAARVFANCERARTWHSALGATPGLYASVNDVTDGGINIPDYIGATGIQELAAQPVQRTDVITPYAAFPVIQQDVGVGLCWYAAMLAPPRMQGPHGSTEAVAVNGSEISPLTTWDSKITTVLALVGGAVSLTRAGLRAVPDWGAGTPTGYDRLTFVVGREYGLAFPSLAGEGEGFGLPTASVPTVLSDWDTCV